MKQLLKLLLNRVLEILEDVETHTCHSEHEMDDEEYRQVNEGLCEPEQSGSIPFGLCLVIKKMHDNGDISLSENIKLTYYLKEHRPKSLFNNDNLISVNRFYWLPGNWTPRIKWIKKHIKLT